MLKPHAASTAPPGWELAGRSRCFAGGRGRLYLTFTPAGQLPRRQPRGPDHWAGPVLSLLQAAMHRHVDVDPVPDRSGIYRLWLRVTADAIESLVFQRAYWRTSSDFLFEEGNIFFEQAVCENWGISAERARELIRGRMTACQDRPGSTIFPGQG